MENTQNIHTRPSGDDSTTGSISGPGPLLLIQRPEGDASTTTSITSSQALVGSTQLVEGSGEGPMLGADAFYQQREYVGRLGGTQVEQPSLPPDREVDYIHLNMVASKCDKKLFRALMRVTPLAEVEKQECSSIDERKQACAKLLSFWKINAGSQRTFTDLINLLRQIELPTVQSLINELNEVRV